MGKQIQKTAIGVNTNVKRKQGMYGVVKQLANYRVSLDIDLNGEGVLTKAQW